MVAATSRLRTCPPADTWLTNSGCAVSLPSSAVDQSCSSCGTLATPSVDSLASPVRMGSCSIVSQSDGPPGDDCAATLSVTVTTCGEPGGRGRGQGQGAPRTRQVRGRPGRPRRSAWPGRCRRRPRGQLGGVGGDAVGQGAGARVRDGERLRRSDRAAACAAKARPKRCGRGTGPVTVADCRYADAVSAYDDRKSRSTEGSSARELSADSPSRRLDPELEGARGREDGDREVLLERTATGGTDTSFHAPPTGAVFVPGVSSCPGGRRCRRRCRRRGWWPSSRRRHRPKRCRRRHPRRRRAGPPRRCPPGFSDRRSVDGLIPSEHRGQAAGRERDQRCEGGAWRLSGTGRSFLLGQLSGARTADDVAGTPGPRLRSIGLPFHREWQSKRDSQGRADPGQPPRELATPTCKRGCGSGTLRRGGAPGAAAVTASVTSHMSTLHDA